MNFSDSEVVASILKKEGYELTDNSKEANLVLLNTCSIRDKAEQTVRNKLKNFNSLKKQNNKLKVGLLGCMAERLKEKLIEEEQVVDLVVGPDSYKDLPNLLNEVEHNQKAVNVILSKSETYGDISPVRIHNNGINAFVSITRGCDNMCTFCIVPFTRGRERSRSPESIIREIYELSEKGYREVTLLGQNVDSYLWYGGGPKKDFIKASDEQKKNSKRFSNLLDLIASNFPQIRIRFSTSNPQDMTIDVLETIAKYNNICNYIHLPIQSGSDRILKKMNRLHTRQEYLELIKKITIVALSMLLVFFVTIFLILWTFSNDLPNYKFLLNYEPPVSSRVHAGDGQLIAEFALQKRLFVPYEEVPKNVINSFLSAEDKNFFKHPGIDAKGVTRAIINNLKNYLNNF